jgi:hypothetical protein
VAAALPLDGRRVQLDGRLDEAVWASARPITGFTQVDPEEGEPVSQPTEVRILYDESALYVGARLYDDGPVRTRLGRRDMDLLDADWFGVVIDSYHDHRTGFSFDVNPSGVMRDAVKSVGGDGEEQDDNSWDAVWEVATTIDEEGWTAEYRIPFSQLRFNPIERPTWGLQLERVIGRNREYAVFAFTPKDEPGGIARYGHLEGLRGVRPGKRLELLPYVVARGEYVDPGDNPFRTDAEESGSAGLDLLYRLTSDLTLNASINPDFGQVEVDPAVINLGVYETRFDEKRPFFIEGSEIFDFGRNTSGGQLFYSRRIGRTPQLAPPSRAADVPDATNILGAAKLSGKTAGGWSVGVIEAVTSEETARYLDADEVEREWVAEPLTNYFVGRVRRDLRGGRSAFGAMLTAVNRDTGPESVATALRSSAYAGGVDFRHEFGGRAWVLQGSAVGSRIAGTPEALQRVQRAGNHFFQRPDADHLEVDREATSLEGYSVGASLTRQAGRHWRGSLALAATSPGFEANDLGFQTRTDRRDLDLDVSWVETTPGDLLRSYTVTAGVRYEHNYDWERIASWWRLSASFRTLDWWGGHVGFFYQPRALDDRLTRGGPLAERPEGWTAFGGIGSDPRKDVTVSVFANGSRNVYDGWSAGGDITLGLKPSSRWNLSLSPSFERSFTRAQYVGTLPASAPDEGLFGDHYLFAPIEQTTLSMETRLNVTFTPRLSLEVYAQPFISSGDYGATASLAAPRSYEFEPMEIDDLPSLDFNYRSLRGNAVLRWEWRPGSTLFLAWQQTRADRGRIGDFDFRRDADSLFGAPPDDIFVLKVNYWLSP